MNPMLPEPDKLSADELFIRNFLAPLLAALCTFVVLLGTAAFVPNGGARACIQRPGYKDEQCHTATEP